MKLAHFSISEFDSPDAAGSGRFMDQDFLRRLDSARASAGIPFVISSGFRTPEHHDSLTGKGYATSKTSAHLKGLAADIVCHTSHDRWIILQALFREGFNRVGIGESFVHVDADCSKAAELIWVY